MSLQGYINTGLNQSLNGSVSIEDGGGTITNGTITTNELTCDTLTLADINVTGTATIDNLVVTGQSNLTGLLTLAHGIDNNGGTIDTTGNMNIGTSLVVGSFTNINGILRANAGMQLGTGQTLEMKSGSIINANSLNISDVEMSYLDGASSNIQTQITDISYSGGVTTIANDLEVVSDASIDGELNVTGATTLDGFLTLAHGLQNNGGTISTTGNVNIGTTLTVANTGTFNGAVKMNAGGELGTSQTLTMKSGSVINANSLNVSDVEVGYLDGVSSNIQTQINTNNTNISTLTTKYTDISYSGGVTTIANDLVVNGNTTLGNATTDTQTITGQPYFSLTGTGFPATSSTRTGLELWRNASGGDGEVDMIADLNGGADGGFRFYNRTNAVAPVLLMDLKRLTCNFQGLNLSTTGTFNCGAITSSST